MSGTMPKILAGASAILLLFVFLFVRNFDTSESKNTIKRVEQTAAPNAQPMEAQDDPYASSGKTQIGDALEAEEAIEFGEPMMNADAPDYGQPMDFGEETAEAGESLELPTAPMELHESPMQIGVDREHKINSEMAY